MNEKDLLEEIGKVSEELGEFKAEMASLEKGDTATAITSTNGAARLLAAGNLSSFTLQGIVIHMLF